MKETQPPLGVGPCHSANPTAGSSRLTPGAVDVSCPFFALLLHQSAARPRPPPAAHSSSAVRRTSLLLISAVSSLLAVHAATQPCSPARELLVSECGGGRDLSRPFKTLPSGACSLEVLACMVAHPVRSSFESDSSSRMSMSFSVTHSSTRALPCRLGRLTRVQYRCLFLSPLLP